MWSKFYGTLLTVFIACAGTVHAANDLDGKALLCVSTSSNTNYPVYGLVFDKGKVSRYEVDGYSKFIAYKIDYKFVETKRVRWYGGDIPRDLGLIDDLRRRPVPGNRRRVKKCGRGVSG